MKELESGWTVEPGNGIYHFAHIDRKKADAFFEQRERTYVVETINHTLADENTVHHNQYFCYTLSGAIAKAAQLEISAQEVAEEVFAIRPATNTEVATFFDVADHYEQHMPAALSDEAVGKLPG